MNLGTKSFRAIASAALGLAMMAGIGSGVVSAEPVNVTLTAAGNVCTGTLTSGASFEMGSYKWNGSAYVAQSGAGSAPVAGTLNASGAPGDRNCKVTFTSSDVSNGTNVAFTANDVTLNVGPWSQSLGAGYTETYNNIPLTGQVFPAATIKLPQSTTAFVPVGNYSGTLTITASVL